MTLSNSNALRRQKLPIGIQSFEKLITQDFKYVDKTRFIYDLVHNNVPYFLSRPRRFGKSLLVSTLNAYWLGQRELFRGLAIEALEVDNPDAWQPYPVFYFDFNRDDYRRDGALEDILRLHLSEWEKQYGCEGSTASLAIRFQNLLRNARNQSGKLCVVLIDEYDKPLLDLMGQDEQVEHNKAVMKGFFSSLKSCDSLIQFVFITGVSKFNKVSIFSDLNHLKDISVNEEYAGICGITEQELLDNFAAEIERLAQRQNLSKDACLDELRITYDGYHFHPNGVGVYNPFSLLNALSDGEFSSYWFETGTPTFLVDLVRQSDFDVRKFTDGTLFASEGMLSEYRADKPDPLPLLYQTGYLTIIGYDRESRCFTLGYPNAEVKYGFLENLLPAFVRDYGPGTGTDIFTLNRYISDGNFDGVRDLLTALFAGIPYIASGKAPFEHYFQTVIYLVFTLLGKLVHCETHTFTGRIDCIVEAKRFVYLFEFKRDEPATSALEQIEKNQYALKYAADPRKLYKIGVSFDSDTRMLTEWEVRE